jgi:ABC-type phosphate transport system substrate-binding protein/predicted regulator of Ras-like GTPase activity (Roadblock/LC7/MglB family)
VQALLEDLNLLPGVVGSMFCDAQAGVLWRAFPAEFDEGSLAAVASAVAASTPELKPLTGRIGVLDLRYREARVLIRPAGEGSLVVLCTRSANVREVLAFASVACKKFEGVQRPGATEPVVPPAVPVPEAGPPALGTTAPAVPVTEPGTPAPGTIAPAVPVPGPGTPAPGAIAPAGTGVRADRPRRRFPLPAVVMAVAALVLAVGAGAAYLTYRLVAPRPTPVAAVVPPVPPARAEPAARPVEVKLRLSGADTLAAELVPALAAAYLGAQKATDVQVTRPGPDVVVVQGVRDGATVGVEIKPGATAQGLDDLLAGTADVALAARRVNAEERQKLSALGTMTSAANEHVLGVDGITVVVNKANSVASLNREQLGLILSGELGDWSRLAVPDVLPAGVPSSLHVYLPEDRSGIPEVVQAGVLGGRPFAGDARRLPTPQAVAEAVGSDPGGLGLVSMATVAGARAVPLADRKEPPRVPTALTVAAEEYLLTHRLYLYTAQASPNPEVSQFVEFALSVEGQAVVRKAGFVELGAKTEPRQPGGAPAEPAPVATGTRRLTGAGAVPVVSHAQPASSRKTEAGPAGGEEADDGGAVASTTPSPPVTPTPAPTSNPTQPVRAAVEDAPPVYASGGYEKPRMAEQGCVQRAVRMPEEVLDHVAGKTITVKFAVGRDGAPSRFQLMTPGMPDRAGSAIWAAIQSCKWTPGNDPAGGAAAIWVVMPFRFTRD